MKPSTTINRRDFVKLGTLAATAAVVSVPASAAARTYQAAPLPFEFNALEPHIDAATMEIHYGKHHASYVTQLNAALATSTELSAKPLESILAELPGVSDEAKRNVLRNNGGGHWNHDFFWNTLSPPAGSGKPTDALMTAIKASFGSMDDFKKAFGEAAAKRFGSGWAWLVVQNGKLKITSTPNQDNPIMKGIVPDSDLGVPLLGLDVWEHAYYLHYQNKRPEYVAAWWNVVNWPAVSDRFQFVQ